MGYPGNKGLCRVLGDLLVVAATCVKGLRNSDSFGFPADLLEWLRSMKLGTVLGTSPPVESSLYSTASKDPLTVMYVS